MGEVPPAAGKFPGVCSDEEGEEGVGQKQEDGKAPQARHFLGETLPGRDAQHVQRSQDRERNDAQRHPRSRGQARLKVSFRGIYAEQQKRKREAGTDETQTQRNQRGCSVNRREGGSCPITRNQGHEGLPFRSQGTWASHSTCTPSRFVTLKRG